MSEATMDSVFHRTAAGTRACSSDLAETHRSILRSIGEATHFDAIATRLAQRPVDEILRCLDDLQAIGLIESVPLAWLVELCMLDAPEVQPRISA